MTLILALRCSNGLVMASDSQASEAYAGVRWSVQKCFPLGHQAVWGSSGQTQVAQDLKVAYEAMTLPLPDPPDLGQHLVDSTRPTFGRFWTNHLNLPGTATPATSVLACGYSTSGEPWIVEIEPNLMYNHYEADRGFHAIGSGAGLAYMANAMLAPLDVMSRSVDHGVVVAYRAMATAISVAGMYVSDPIRIWVVQPGLVSELDDDQKVEVRNAVGGWQEEEGHALDRALGVAERPVSPMPGEL